MRRLAWPAGAYAALTVLITWPLVRQLGSVFPHDAGDPVLNTWILWWSTRRVPLSAAWWNAPMFFPMGGAMALSETLIGLLPVTAPIQAMTGNPLAAYNVAFLLSFPLSGLAAYALAYELTGRRDAAFAAGLAFAFAPYRAGQLAHVQMLSYYWSPAVLFGLHRYLRTTHRRWLFVFAAAWLMQALSNGYALFHLSILVALWTVWFARRPCQAVPIAVAWAAAAVVAVPMLLHYRAVHAALHLVRDINEIKRFSADLTGLAAASPDLAVWGSRLVAARPETALFPGATVAVVLAIAGVRVLRRRAADRSRWPPGRRAAAGVAVAAGVVALSAVVIGPWRVGRVLTVDEFQKPFSIAMIAVLAVAIQSVPWRAAWRERSTLAFYGAAAATMYVLAFGPAPTAFGQPFLYEAPYAWLMRLPGFDVLRVPARFAMLAVLCQTVVVALTVAKWPSGRRKGLAVAVVCLGVLADGWIHLPLEAAPLRGPKDWPGVAAVLELPPGSPRVDFPAMFRSMFHERPIVNGFSGYAPPFYVPLVHAIRDDQLEVLREVAAHGPIGVAIDRSLDGADDLAARLERLGGAERLQVTDAWTTYRVVGRGSSLEQFGAPLPIEAVRANRRQEDVGRLADGMVDSAWGSGGDQSGNEILVIDLGSPVHVGAIVLEMGAFAFGFPRDLAIDASEDGEQWRELWRGRTAALTVRAALAEPGVVPLTVPLGGAVARIVRLRQLGREDGIPWWIAELAMRAPGVPRPSY